MDIKNYQEVSSDVWRIFKKYFPAEVTLETFADDVHALDEKYRNKNIEEYRFMQKLLKVYFDELGYIKDLQEVKK